VSNRVKTLVSSSIQLCVLTNCQISAVVKSSFFQLRSIAKVKKMLSEKDIERVIYAFITSRLDYFYSFYLGLPRLDRFQLVLNVAARLLTGTTKREQACSSCTQLSTLATGQVISSHRILPRDLFGHSVIYSKRWPSLELPRLYLCLNPL